MRFTEEQIIFVGEAYRQLTIPAILPKFQEEFGLSVTEAQITALTRNHRLRSGRETRFKKGDAPFNKGTKGLMKANVTTFAPGSIPKNTQPLWHERLGTDGYLWMKVPEANPYTKAKTRYKQKNHYVWEQEHGPLPEGHTLIFKDGNPLNCDLSNLLLVTRKELICLNLLGYKDAPAEIKPSILALARLQAKAGVRSKSPRAKKEKYDGA